MEEKGACKSKWKTTTEVEVEACKSTWRRTRRMEVEDNRSSSLKWYTKLRSKMVDNK